MTSKNQPQILAMALVGAGLLLLGAVGIALLPGWAAGRSPNRPRAESGSSAIPAEVDFAAPEVSLTDLDGNAVSLDGLSGQVVLVNNWATWCPPCKAEMPTLQAYYEAYQGRVSRSSPSSPGSRSRRWRISWSSSG